MKTLLLDIETQPNLAWVWGMYKQHVNPAQLEKPKEILCFATEWLEAPYKPTFLAEWTVGRQGMAIGARALLDEADAVITYNGDRFDLPHLKALMLTEGLTPPSPYRSIDLYKTMKQFELPFRKLGYVTELLGLSTKSETGGFQLWKDVMAGDLEAQRRMQGYNENDVTIMRDLYYRLLPWIKSPPNRLLYDDDEDIARCARPACRGKLEKRGTRATGVGLYQRYRCTECGGWTTSGKRLEGADLRPENN